MRQKRASSQMITGTVRGPYSVRSLSFLVVVGLLFGSTVKGTDHAGATAVERKILVTCTTTLLSSVVTAVAGQDADVHTIVPFGMCPGHFDLTPGEVHKLMNADILLYHGFERFLGDIEFYPRTKVVRANVSGNWMIPDIHTQAVQRVVSILSETSPRMNIEMSRNADAYNQIIAQKANAAKMRLAKYKGIPVTCSDMNRDLAEWFGFKVVAKFARDEDVSVSALHRIVAQSRKLRARLVIDNKQSGGKMGRTIARELDVPMALLSNFPESDSTETDKYPYIRTLDHNCNAILEALAGREGKVE
ncbi:MAG: zinc ABC transporter substrate-binding protein [Lentisphaerae bacterium]|nr:zinc ABC transporter substrate-binding protein [Lentisphaerota bacterium]